MVTSANAIHAARLAALAHGLVGQKRTWEGSPLTAAELEEVATTAARRFDEHTLLKGLHETDVPGELLVGILAIAWAAGFKTGSMLAEERRT